MVFGMTLGLGEAGRRGRFQLILPLSALDVIRASIQVRNEAAARDRPNDLWKTLMRRAAASAPVRVDAVLHRQRLSLAALQALHVGQVLEIPRQSVEQVRLTIPQPGGRTALLAQGRLGAYQDHKVVKLLSPPDRRVVPTSTARCGRLPVPRCRCRRRRRRRPGPRPRRRPRPRSRPPRSPRLPPASCSG